MSKYVLAVKAIITNPECDKILLLHNSMEDVNRPGAEDFPGGRLETGENPYDGLKRELTEELGKELADNVEINWPLDASYFSRPDGQVVSLITFHCSLLKNAEIKISAEHSRFDWISFADINTTIKGKMMLRPCDRMLDGFDIKRKANMELHNII
jgi:8-oxo-dGTP pyrophosphatase MutT (NUDIX family)